MPSLEEALNAIDARYAPKNNKWYWINGQLVQVTNEHGEYLEKSDSTTNTKHNTNNVETTWQE